LLPGCEWAHYTVAMTSRNLILLTIVALLPLAPGGEALASETTKVVLLGTGTPNPEPDRSGPAVAIVVNDTPYLVDFGPGVVRRAAAMSPDYGGSLEGLQIERLKVCLT